MSQLGPAAPVSGIYSVPRADDPPYTATSLLLAGRHREAAQMTRRIIATAYSPPARAPGDQPTNYARTLLILALATAGLGEIDEAPDAGAAALESGRIVWPTMVLAGKLDQSLTARSPGSAHTATSRALPRRRHTARPSPATGPEGTPMTDGELTAVQVATLTASVDIDAPPPDTEAVRAGPVRHQPDHACPDRGRPVSSRPGTADYRDRRHQPAHGHRGRPRVRAPARRSGRTRKRDTRRGPVKGHLAEHRAFPCPTCTRHSPWDCRSSWSPSGITCARCTACGPSCLTPCRCTRSDGIRSTLGRLVRRDNWPACPDGRRRVVRESQEVPRHVAEGSYLQAFKKGGAWLLSSGSSSRCMPAQLAALLAAEQQGEDIPLAFAERRRVAHEFSDIGIQVSPLPGLPSRGALYCNLPAGAVAPEAPASWAASGSAPVALCLARREFPMNSRYPRIRRPQI